MQLQEQLAYYRGILLQKLERVQEKEELIELMLVLAVGMLSGLYNPNQVAQQLGISAKQLYEELKEMSAHRWRKLLESLMMEAAKTALKNYEAGSAATQSRQQASISVDDSVVKRLGKVLSYVWVWYSGQIHQRTNGQDLIGIVLKIGNQILPLRLVLVSKQGRDNTEKPDGVIRELSSLKAAFLEAGIDITNLGISFDSWWLGHKFIEKLNALGFDKQVLCAKQNTQLKVGREQKSLAEYFFDNIDKLKPGWGHTTPAARLKGTNSEFGKIAVVLFDVKRSTAFAIVLPARLLRTCEALRIWLNHPAVETFWKRLKHWLGQGKMSLRGRDGAWAEICLRVLAFFFALRLFDENVGTLNQLYHFLRRQSTFADLVAKHFHPLFLATYAFSHS
jgi:hypothetical protein